ncbi:hypothetical protein Tco_0245493 [Tanacetum coccineum]
MRTDELYKFSDGTFTSVRTVLHDIASNLRMGYDIKRSKSESKENSADWDGASTGINPKRQKPGQYIAIRNNKLLSGIEDSHDGPSDAMHNPPQPLKLYTAYPIPLNTAYPVCCPIQRIHLNRSIRLRMTKVIKGEFEKIKDVKAENVSLTCDTLLEIFNMEVSRLCKMDDDLFTYEVEVGYTPCNSKVDDDLEDEVDDDMGYDPSDVTFIKWLGSKFFNYKTMDQYTMKALWIYWIRGDDKVELTDEESSDNDDV